MRTAERIFENTQQSKDAESRYLRHLWAPENRIVNNCSGISRPVYTVSRRDATDPVSRPHYTITIYYPPQLSLSLLTRANKEWFSSDEMAENLPAGNRLHQVAAEPEHSRFWNSRQLNFTSIHTSPSCFVTESKRAKLSHCITAVFRLPDERVVGDVAAAWRCTWILIFWSRVSGW